MFGNGKQRDNKESIITIVWQQIISEPTDLRRGMIRMFPAARLLRAPSRAFIVSSAGGVGTSGALNETLTRRSCGGGATTATRFTISLAGFRALRERVTYISLRPGLQAEANSPSAVVIELYINMTTRCAALRHI